MSLENKQHRKPKFNLKKDINNLEIGLYYAATTIVSLVLSIGVLSLITKIF
ncbi:MAG: hypothetical protein HeimC3_21040 [Candidatus Heimdallarchaeota archaeon LC_3]|nr:MAG: hypothetical protein HeimC3_21040 [Candidatus Heimdallarchaeota archaeon LC_3]